jgi:hypothetical protein
MDYQVLVDPDDRRPLFTEPSHSKPDLKSTTGGIACTTTTE